MKLIFWQNIISIHQLPFLNALSKNRDVILIVGNELTEDLKNAGWIIPDFEDIELIVSPNSTEVANLLHLYHNEWHIISGINAYPLPSLALKLAIAINVENIAVLTESFKTVGFKGMLRKIKYKVASLKYRNYIKAIFVTGKMARRCFENLYFSNNILFDWGYFTQISNGCETNETIRSLPNLLFVGSIDKRKNIISVLPDVIKHSHLFDTFYISGTGSLLYKLKSVIGNKNNIKYLGVNQNDSIQSLMKNCDLLILPSLFDGWGAVVNEALCNGMRVFCSENCGSSILLDDDKRGGIFKFEENNFKNGLRKWLEKGVISNKERKGIIEWSREHISGQVAAQYFTDSINFLETNEGIKPVAPWIK
ncbi:MAG: glycosyltransferase [Psychroserpens sp.]|uniref:glycosyltransferase n=1 Tax=Psychroserpens sp. TaxID=2020870 RepID=UPI003C95B7E2